MMTIDLTPMNQVSPRYEYEIRTDTARRALRDLRNALSHGWRDLANGEIMLADGRRISWGNAVAGDGRSSLLGVFTAEIYPANDVAGCYGARPKVYAL